MNLSLRHKKEDRKKIQNLEFSIDGEFLVLLLFLMFFFSPLLFPAMVSRHLLTSPSSRASSWRRAPHSNLLRSLKKIK